MTQPNYQKPSWRRNKNENRRADDDRCQGPREPNFRSNRVIKGHHRNPRPKNGIHSSVCAAKRFRQQRRRPNRDKQSIVRATPIDRRTRRRRHRRSTFNFLQRCQRLPMRTFPASASARIIPSSKARARLDDFVFVLSFFFIPPSAVFLCVLRAQFRWLQPESQFVLRVIRCKFRGIKKHQSPRLGCLHWPYLSERCPYFWVFFLFRAANDSR